VSNIALSKGQSETEREKEREMFFLTTSAVTESVLPERQKI
jgi:hypothetical protein